MVIEGVDEFGRGLTNHPAPQFLRKQTLLSHRLFHCNSIAAQLGSRTPITTEQDVIVLEYTVVLLLQPNVVDCKHCSDVIHRL